MRANSVLPAAAEEANDLGAKLTDLDRMAVRLWWEGKRLRAPAIEAQATMIADAIAGVRRTLNEAR